MLYVLQVHLLLYLFAINLSITLCFKIHLLLSIFALDVFIAFRNALNLFIAFILYCDYPLSPFIWARKSLVGLGGLCKTSKRH